MSSTHGVSGEANCLRNSTAALASMSVWTSVAGLKLPRRTRTGFL